MASRFPGVPVEWCRVAACLQLVVAESYPVVAESYPVVAESYPVVVEAYPVVAEFYPVVVEPYPVVACPGAEEPCRVGAASLAWVPAAD